LLHLRHQLAELGGVELAGIDRCVHEHTVPPARDDGYRQ
jgi:hypothetical protein